MANWSNPTLTSAYSNFLADLKARDEDLAKQFDGQTVSNLVTGAIRWNSSINRWQKWDGTAWGELASTYALTALSTTGGASIGGALTVTGATALNGGATTTTAATADNSTTIATTAFVKAQAYATLASPALTGTPTVPTAAAGTNTTQAASTAFVNSAISGIGIQRPATGVLSFSTSNGEVFRATAANGLALGSTAANANVGFRHSKSITGGTTSWAQYIDGTIQTDVTTSAIGIGTSIGTAASTTLTTLVHYQAAADVFGAGTTVTNQIGFSASSTLSGATNDYGFYGALAAGTGSWNCYMVGTAANFFAGQVQLGAGSAGTPSLATNGDTDSGIYFPAAGQVGVVTNGALAALFDDNGDLSIYNAAGTFNHRFANQPTANRTVTLPDADVTLVAGTMAPTASPAFTGTPTAPTASVGTNTTQLATTAFVLANASSFPAGTAMLFVQTAAPTGWTKSTTHDNKALRVVSGAASSGGTTAFTSVFASRTPSGTIANTTDTGTVGSTTLTESQIPSHTHIQQRFSTGSYAGQPVAYGTGLVTTPVSAGMSTQATGGGDSHNHSLTMNAHNHTFTGTALDFAVQYVDVIIATKN